MHGNIIIGSLPGCDLYLDLYAYAGTSLVACTEECTIYVACKYIVVASTLLNAYICTCKATFVK